jgi:L-histidine N-alpha-methyltransferase
VPATAIRIRQVLRDDERRRRLVRDVVGGLARRPRSLPPRYFYDDRGSRLFARICRTPEYYLTRTEKALLQRVAPEVVARIRPRTLVELGPGPGVKRRRFLDAMAARGEARRYVPVDVNRGVVEAGSEALVARYPGLRIAGVVGDFGSHPAGFPAEGPRLVLFLGSTLGNYDPPEAVALLRGVGRRLAPDDGLALGVDLVKEERLLNAAYNDAAGITAEFNRNLLRVLNRELDADFVPRRFRHVAFYDRRRRRVEMHLESGRDQRVELPGVGIALRLRRGERICTEHSCKYTRRSIGGMLRRAGMRLDGWWTDPRGWFAIALARPAGPRAARGG